MEYWETYQLFNGILRKSQKFNGIMGENINYLIESSEKYQQFNGILRKASTI